MIRIACACAVLLFACNEHGSGGNFPDGGSGSGSGSGRRCGGFAGDACSANEFCDFALNSCGATDEQGICRTRPNGCPDLFAPVCGCDRVVHSNECDANAAGADVDAFGSCPVPAGDFVCGFRTCDKATEYCQRGVSDIGGEPDTFACMPLPGSCGAAATCGCLMSEPCGSFCEGSQSSGFTVTCPGG